MQRQIYLSLTAAIALAGFAADAVAGVSFYLAQPNGYDQTNFYQSSPITDTIETGNMQGETGQGTAIQGIYNTFNVRQVGGSYNWTVITQGQGATNNNDTITDNVNGSANGIHHIMNGSSDSGTQTVNINGSGSYVGMYDGGSLGALSTAQLVHSIPSAGTGNTMTATVNGNSDFVQEVDQPGNYNDFSATINGSLDTISLNGNIDALPVTNNPFLPSGNQNEQNSLTGMINSGPAGNDVVVLATAGSSNTLHGVIDGNDSTMNLSAIGLGNTVTGQIGALNNPSSGYGDNMVVNVNGNYNNVSATQNGNYNFMNLYMSVGSSYNTLNATQGGSDYMNVALSGTGNNVTVVQSPGKALGSTTQPYTINATGWTATINQ